MSLGRSGKSPSRSVCKAGAASPILRLVSQQQHYISKTWLPNIDVWLSQRGTGFRPGGGFETAGQPWMEKSRGDAESFASDSSNIVIVHEGT